jgi:hypothetical protein
VSAIQKEQIAIDSKAFISVFLESKLLDEIYTEMLSQIGIKNEKRSSLEDGKIILEFS